MKKRPWLIIPLLLAAAILAYLVQSLVEFLIITPLADLWWVLGVLYRTIPQIACWILVLVVVAMIAVGSLSGLFNGDRTKRSARRQDRGPVEDLAWFIAQRKRSRYFRWFIARRMGQLATAMLARQDESLNGTRPNILAGKDWQPPEKIQQYLETGLRRYEAPDRNLESILSKNQTLEVDPQEVVAYLETQMEKRSGRKYS